MPNSGQDHTWRRSLTAELPAPSSPVSNLDRNREQEGSKMTSELKLEKASGLMSTQTSILPSKDLKTQNRQVVIWLSKFCLSSLPSSDSQPILQSCYVPHFLFLLMTLITTHSELPCDTDLHYKIWLPWYCVGLTFLLQDYGAQRCLLSWNDCEQATVS